MKQGWLRGDRGAGKGAEGDEEWWRPSRRLITDWVTHCCHYWLYLWKTLFSWLSQGQSLTLQISCAYPICAWCEGAKLPCGCSSFFSGHTSSGKVGRTDPDNCNIKIFEPNKDVTRGIWGRLRGGDCPWDKGELPGKKKLSMAQQVKCQGRKLSRSD